MDFQHIEKKYRPVPFWSLNEKLQVAQTAEQVDVMDKAGIGGYFMHARGGLQTEFMGDEWFENIGCAVEEANARGMYAWAYDENGWPSGFGNGKVNGLGLAYQQKYLRMDADNVTKENTICSSGGHTFSFDVNPFYVDTLDPKVTAEFIRQIYEPYYEKFGNKLTGFFTDEPQISRNGIPWSFILPEAYQAAYGEDIFSVLPALFLPVGEYKQVRIRFWKLVTDLFSQNFMKQIYDWCTAHGYLFTGHMVLEENLLIQITSNGACMPHYEYFHEPGMDWLGRQIHRCLTPTAVSSVAQQLGKKHVLSETFALCGHNVGHDELKRIYEWQMVRGINKLCTHLDGYSMRGIRKRDYPPAMFRQQPWWPYEDAFNDFAARAGKILSEGEVHPSILVLHPQTTAWTMFDNGGNTGIQELHEAFLNTLQTLEEKHLLFHLGDETILERHARVEGNTLVVGEQRYTTLLLPVQNTELYWLPNTEYLLREFTQNGGILLTDAAALPENPVINCGQITYTSRTLEGMTVHYFVNSTEEEWDTVIPVGDTVVDLRTGDTQPFDGHYRFQKFDSLLLLDTGKQQCAAPKTEPLRTLPLDGSWQIKAMTDNTLTLDHCDYYFDGVLQQKNGFVLNIQNRACALQRPVEVRCDFHVKVKTVPQTVYLGVETPEIFRITVNGKPVDKTDCGYYYDTSVRKLNLAGLLQPGENTITLETHFAQSAQIYENLQKALVFESEKNKLTYDMEIEAIYLIGDFSVSTPGQYSELPRNACRYMGDFILDAPVKELTLQQIQRQGLPFFAGSLTLQKTLCLDETDYALRFSKTGINVVQAKVNGQDCGTFLWEPYEADLRTVLHPVENTVELTLVNNLRNLLGPHHLQEGESYSVGPNTFFAEPCVWNMHPEKTWDDRYCFAEMNLLER